MDLVVAMGSDAYDIGIASIAGIPVVTYDDATLMQQWRNGSSDIANAGFPPGEVERWIATQRTSARRADACCVSTEWAARSFVDDYGVPAARVHVVGMGHRPRSVPRERPTSGGPRFLMVGLDWERKNGAAIVSAFKQVRADHPSAELHLVGEHPQITTEPGVVGHGVLSRADPRAQQKLDELYASAAAFVLPSRFDPSPIAYLEAASFGLPVVATTQGGALSLLGDGAIAVDPDDHAAIVAAMNRLAEPVEAQRVGAAAAAAAARSTWRDVASRILAVLEHSMGTA